MTSMVAEGASVPVVSVFVKFVTTDEGLLTCNCTSALVVEKLMVLTPRFCILTCNVFWLEGHVGLTGLTKAVAPKSSD